MEAMHPICDQEEWRLVEALIVDWKDLLLLSKAFIRLASVAYM